MTAKQAMPPLGPDQAMRRRQAVRCADLVGAHVAASNQDAAWKRRPTRIKESR